VTEPTKSRTIGIIDVGLLVGTQRHRRELGGNEIRVTPTGFRTFTADKDVVRIAEVTVGVMREQPIHRHEKRGAEYTRAFRANRQSEKPVIFLPVLKTPQDNGNGSVVANIRVEEGRQVADPNGGIVRSDVGMKYGVHIVASRDPSAGSLEPIPRRARSSGFPSRRSVDDPTRLDALREKRIRFGSDTSSGSPEENLPARIDNGELSNLVRTVWERERNTGARRHVGVNRSPQRLDVSIALRRNVGEADHIGHVR
jgi:hypothetical protein